MNSNYRPIVFAAVMVCLSLCCLSISSAVEFTTSTNITADDTTFDGDDVLVNGCVLTVEGDHSFSTMAITNGGSAEFNGTKLNLTALQLDGSDFELAGGATVDVSNAISLQDASTLLVKSTNTGAKVGDEWAGQGGTVHADDLSVSGDSAISADAQGYAGGSGDNGEGRGPGGGGPRGGLGTEAAGGGYGGDGGSCSYAVGGSSYGSSTAPLGPGSGGASDSSSSGRGGSGGGAIRLDVAGTLTLDGAISADGQSRTASWEGGGSGGAIWATVGTLTGSGAFTADGGDGDGSRSAGGGGGRIAVYYEQYVGFNGFAASTAEAGSGDNSTYDGHEGTVAFFETDPPTDILHVYNRFELPSGSNDFFGIDLSDSAIMAVETSSVLNVEEDFMLAEGSAFTLGGGSTLNVGQTLSIAGNSTLLGGGLHTGAQVGGVWGGEGVVVTVNDMLVESGSVFSANGQGYTGGAGDNGVGQGPGGGNPRPGFSGGGGGGGYGGAGGSYYDATGGPSYGSPTAPLGPGSGGASDSSSSGRGGSGGGAIRLDVAGTLTLDGAISADGQSRTASCEGGGSGGAIWATVGTLTGSGNFTADGGDGDGSLSCGGGGGRIAVYYQAGGSFSGFVASTAAKGAGNNSNYDGYEGTVAFFDTSVAGNHLYLYQYLALGTVMDTYGAITLLNGATFALGADSQLEVTGNVVLDEESELDMGGGSELQVGGTLDIKDSSTLLARGKNTNGQVGGVWTGRGLSIEAVNISIDSNSLISADAHGYTGENQSAGNGPGAGAIDNYAAGGAGYGGVGGDGAGSASGGGTYGLAQRPTRLGSGGGGGASSSSGTYGGNGGGAVRIVATGTLQMDGAIRANGGSTSGNHCSGGAGGSIWIDAYDIAGAGSLSANGGAAGLQSGGGGGGRIAVYYWNSSTWPEGNLSLLGGTGTKAGQPGESIVGAKSPYWWQESEIIDCYLSSGSIHLVIDSPLAGWTNNIERASSLQDDDWERVGGFAATESAYIWNDPETSNTPAFYRVISEELE